MTDKKRMVAVAIGVSNAEGLPFLAAAINCAEGFFRWATTLGYEAKLITDKDNAPVTIERLRSEIDAILKDVRPIHRMVIYFAGHGMIRELESGEWLLSNWKSEGVVVAYESMRRRLATFGIKQIAIFSDACRSLPKSVFELQLEQRSVLALGRIQGEPDLDKFVAAKDGNQSFVVPGSTETNDVCVFSGVLLEALWGEKQEAFSKVSPNSITSSSLGNYLKEEVPRVAQRYGLILQPTVLAAFPEGDNIYLTKGTLTNDIPPFEWPQPPGPLPSVPQLTLTVPELHAEVGFITGPDAEAASPPRHHGARTDQAKISRKRKASTPSLLERLRGQQLPRGLEMGSGFAVEGAEICQLWTPNHVLAEQYQNASWWKVRGSNNSYLNEPAPILIEFTDGRFAALAALPRFVAGLVCDSRGVSAVVYRPSNSEAGAQHTEDAIGLLERGALRADEVTDLAARIRVEKHLDPTLGVFAAYLYDSIGDVGSIRRMAYFYVMHGQPIPYDIALLAQIRCRQIDNCLKAFVPPVTARKPRSDAEQEYSWTYEKTPACEGVVGGAWPWLRQGWAFLADPTDDESTLMSPGLAQLTKHLTRSRFTTFDRVGGCKLAKRFNLHPQ